MSTTTRTTRRAAAAGLLLLTSAVLVAGPVASAGAAPGPSPDPGADPGRSPSTYQFIATNPDGSPVRFNPCTPIHYIVVPGSAAPAEAAANLADAQSAVAAVSAVSGLQFVFAGTYAVGQRVELQAKQALRISFVTHAEYHASGGIGWDGAAGVGGAGAELLSGGRRVFRQGDAVVFTDTTDPDGALEGLDYSFRRAVAIHEIGHAVGLQHTTDPASTMYAGGSYNQDFDFTPGDTWGFRHVGAMAGCVDETRAAPRKVCSKVRTRVPVRNARGKVVRYRTATVTQCRVVK